MNSSFLPVDWQMSQFECLIRLPTRRARHRPAVRASKRISAAGRSAARAEEAAVEKRVTAPRKSGRKNPRRINQRFPRRTVSQTAAPFRPTQEQIARRTHLLFLAHGCDPTGELEDWRRGEH